MVMRIGSIAFVLPVILLLIVYSLDLSHITECDQQGLTYSIETGACEAGKVELISYYARHPLLVNLSMLVATIGALAMTWGMILKGITRPTEER
ncbi:hypothetical protein [Oceanobacter mangrovi]|uniref:hypothetical protein n=1 Tax=Oceanobacter mangrovi TaxID=2862510 RepID=UPI001C8D5837|nr:hypothetical protein [Oceanobacter mangrovi]